MPSIWLDIVCLLWCGIVLSDSNSLIHASLRSMIGFHPSNIRTLKSKSVSKIKVIITSEIFEPLKETGKVSLDISVNVWVKVTDTSVLFLASQDAQEVMFVTDLLTDWLTKRYHWLDWCDPGKWWIDTFWRLYRCCSGKWGKSYPARKSYPVRKVVQWEKVVPWEIVV